MWKVNSADIMACMKKFFAVCAFLSCLLTPLAAQEDPPPVKVRVATAEETEAYTGVMYGARVEPADRFDIRSPLTGTVVSMAVAEGTRIAAGDLIFTVRRELSGRTFQAQEVRTERGGLVSKAALREGDPVSEGAAVVTVIDDSSYSITILVSDRDAPAVRVGTTCSLYNDGSALPVRGRVSAKAVEPDYSTGLFEVTLGIPKHPSVTIGRFLRVEIRKDFFRGIVVPTDNLERRYGGLYLPVVRDDATIELREITPFRVYGDRTALKAGLEPGEQYVVWSELRLQDGSPVEIIR